MTDFLFKCSTVHRPLMISQEFVQDMGFRDPAEFHRDAAAIAAVVERDRRERNSRIWRLPLCHTLEAEALGARPVLSWSGAWIREVPYAALNEVPKAMELSQGRHAAVWASMDRLRQMDTTGLIAFDLLGPFSVLNGLIPPAQMFKAARKGGTLFDKIEPLLIDYARCACDHGAAILSVADPIAALDVLGEPMFRQNYAPGLCRMLRRLQRVCPETVIHLCGRLSQDLLNTGFLSAAEYPACKAGGTREELLLQYLAEGPPYKMVGVSCMNLLQNICDSLTLLQMEDLTERNS